MTVAPAEFDPYADVGDGELNSGIVVKGSLVAVRCKILGVRRQQVARFTMDFRLVAHRERARRRVWCVREHGQFGSAPQDFVLQPFEGSLSLAVQEGILMPKIPRRQ